jgi:hypothetical protein
MQYFPFTNAILVRTLRWFWASLFQLEKGSKVDFLKTWNQMFLINSRCKIEEW